MTYVLARGASPLSSNSNDQNSIHYAIILEKFHFLSYMFEGDFGAYLEQDFNNRHKRILKELLNDDRHTKRNFIIASFIALDRCSLKEGHTPLH